jgi:hypothetical protein
MLVPAHDPPSLGDQANGIYGWQGLHDHDHNLDPINPVVTVLHQPPRV